MYTYKQLKDKHRKLRDGWHQEWGEDANDFSIRIHRALSWLQKAEQKDNANALDVDASFIFLWISFNAAYGQYLSADAFNGDNSTGDKKLRHDYFRQLSKVGGQEIITCIGVNLMPQIKALVDLKFSLPQFWHDTNIESDIDWQTQLKQKQQDIINAINEGNVMQTLHHLFLRIYVVRNQLMHGGATWQGKINRAQVENSHAIMALLVPLFINIMMQNPHPTRWGNISYPVIIE